EKEILGLQDVPSHVELEVVPFSFGLQDVPSHVELEVVPFSLGLQDVPSHVELEVVPSSLGLQDVPSHVELEMGHLGIFHSCFTHFIEFSFLGYHELVGKFLPTNGKFSLDEVSIILIYMGSWNGTDFDHFSANFSFKNRAVLFCKDIRHYHFGEAK
ncbi:hypothetical protein ACJX0J_021217, partial [Zea mays]